MKILIGLALVFVLAMAAFLYSRTLPHLNDAEAFQAGYAAIEASEDTDAYEALFATHVTERNTIKKYSLSLISLSLGGMILFSRGLKGIKTPPNKWLILPVGLLGVALSINGVIQSTRESYGRGEIPPWSTADAMTAQSVVQVTPLLLIWVLLHGLLLIGKSFSLQTPVLDIRPKFINGFLAAELGLTVIMTLWSFGWGGDYFALLAAPAWIYFYAALIAVRAKGFELKSEV